MTEAFVAGCQSKARNIPEDEEAGGNLAKRARTLMRLACLGLCLPSPDAWIRLQEDRWDRTRSRRPGYYSQRTSAFPTSDKRSEHRSITQSSGFFFLNLCALVGDVARKQTIVSERGKSAKPPTPAHGNNRLIKSEQKKYIKKCGGCPWSPQQRQAAFGFCFFFLPVAISFFRSTSGKGKAFQVVLARVS